MTGICSLCKEIIQPAPATSLRFADRPAVEGLDELSRLTHAMAMHLGNRHNLETNQIQVMAELTATWSLLCHFESLDPTFGALREDMGKRIASAGAEYANFSAQHQLQKGATRPSSQLVELPGRAKASNPVVKADDSTTPSA